MTLIWILSASSQHKCQNYTCKWKKMRRCSFGGFTWLTISWQSKQDSIQRGLDSNAGGVQPKRLPTHFWLWDDTEVGKKKKPVCLLAFWFMGFRIHFFGFVASCWCWIGHTLLELTAQAGQSGRESACVEATEGGVVDTIVVGCKNDV